MADRKSYWKLILASGLLITVFAVFALQDQVSLAEDVQLTPTATPVMNAQEAIEIANKAIELDPKDEQAYVRRGDAFYSLGKLNEAFAEKWATQKSK